MKKTIVSVLCGMLIGVCVSAQTLSNIDENILCVDERPSFYGCLFASSDWKNLDDRNKNIGIYHFYGEKELSLTPVAIGADFAAESGFYMDGRFIFQRPKIEEDFIIGYEFCEIDVINWRETRNPFFLEEDSLFSSDFAYDPTTGNVFGFFKHKNFELPTEFSKVDPNTGIPTLIKSMKVPFVCVASNLDGELYGVDMAGILYKIDKETGDLTEIGFTGLAPKYSQSADFDFRTGKMYWYVSTKALELGLYEVNLTTGKATPLSDMQQKQITAIFIKNPELKAPAMVEEALCVPKEKGGSEVRFSFLLPQKAVDGTFLSEQLNVEIKSGQEKVLAIRTDCSPGEILDFNLQLDKGLQNVTVVVSNQVGEGMCAPFVVWIGEDVPKSPKNVVLTEKDEKAEINWSIEEVGENGGYVDLEKLTYKVVRNDGTVVAEGIQECSFVDESVATMEGSYVYYEVYAESELGISMPAESNAMLLGNSISFPFMETFDNIQNLSRWIEKNDNHEVSAWLWFEKGEYPDTVGFDGENGLISFNAYSGDVPKGTVSRLISPMIDLRTKSSGYLSFAVYHYSGFFQTDDCIEVEIVTKDGVLHKIGDPIRRIADADGWKIYNIPIDDYCGNEIAISFVGISDFGYNMHLDQIQISDNKLVNLKCDSLDSCKFIVEKNVLYILCSEKKSISLFDTNGVCRFTGIMPSDGIYLDPGLYILSIGMKYYKILVP